MKYINLTKGQSALVDDDMFEYLNQWKWYFSDTGYAVRKIRIKRGVKTIRMHRLINNTPEDLFTDHINRNKLDNRRNNLRSVNVRTNQMNKGLQKNNTSGYKGISWDKTINKWKAHISFNYKSINLGSFINIEDAVLARKKGEQIYE